ncbi:MAG TPA: isoprenylcysteine carboxylmethyltransferase family protein [Acetobacteraceae bacterium]|nr:isoprenylcysteine carboxylmethyltransferase family protein [Acetobacteraceae bacterium]
MNHRAWMALAAIAGTLIFLGLAIIGRGGFRSFFSQPALIAVAIATLAMMVTALFARANFSSGLREDRANRWVLPAFGVIGLFDAYLPSYTDRIGFWTIDGSAIRWLGVVLYAVGGALRLWPVFVLGPRFSGLAAIQPGHRLVTDGPYRVIRHPSYLGALVLTLGWGLAFRAGIGLLLTALLILPLLGRIRAEEALLRSEFGQHYDAYRAHTYRLIPGLF